MWVLYIIILLLATTLLTLAVTFLKFVRKSTYFSEKEREFIIFVIDMYVQYAKDLEIHSEEQHDKIVKELEKIKNKHFKDGKKS